MHLKDTFIPSIFVLHSSYTFYQYMHPLGNKPMNPGFASGIFYNMSYRSTCCMYSTVWSDRLTGLDSNEYFQWPGPIRKVPHSWSVTLFATVSSVFTICFWHAFIPRWGSAPLRACLTQNPDLRRGLGIQAPRGTQTQMPAVVYSQVRLTAVQYPAITYTLSGELTSS